MDFTFRIPGTTEPEVTVRRSWLGNIKVLVNGTRAKRRHSRTLSYDIPMSDGTVTELRLTGQWTGLKALANGLELRLEPPVPRVFVGLTFLPLLLVVIGGLIGGLFGVLAAAINARISRAGLGRPAKAIAMLGVTAATSLLYVGLAIAIVPIPTLATGSCLNGVHSGAQLTATSSRAVDCATAHDNEIVGTVRYAGNGPYPGQQALYDFAQIQCIDAFTAYVGTDFQASTLDMTLVTPTDLTWLKGDREIACIISAPQGARLTDSVRGSRR